MTRKRVEAISSSNPASSALQILVQLSDRYNVEYDRVTRVTSLLQAGYLVGVSSLLKTKRKFRADRLLSARVHHAPRRLGQAEVATSPSRPRDGVARARSSDRQKLRRLRSPFVHTGPIHRDPSDLEPAHRRPRAVSPTSDRGLDHRQRTHLWNGSRSRIFRRHHQVYQLPQVSLATVPCYAWS